jgi:SAM-dependent methyltransferase
MPFELKRLYRAAITPGWEQEQKQVLSFMARARTGTGNPCRVLDVGCGYGRNLKALRTRGFDAVGVDVNRDIVKTNIDAGLPCETVEQFERRADYFDIILMAHIVEHFAPTDLHKFVDGYLDCLKPRGHLVIATPLMTNNFFDDFDHVRPYQPVGLLMVFGRGAQVQYYARNCLELLDVWFRRGPWRLNYSRLRFATDWRRHVMQAIDLFCALLFRASFGLLGRTDGWVGLFRKVEY